MEKQKQKSKLMSYSSSAGLPLSPVWSVVPPVGRCPAFPSCWHLWPFLQVLHSIPVRDVGASSVMTPIVYRVLVHSRRLGLCIQPHLNVASQQQKATVIVRDFRDLWATELGQVRPHRMPQDRAVVAAAQAFARHNNKICARLHRAQIL